MKISVCNQILFVQFMYNNTSVLQIDFQTLTFTIQMVKMYKLFLRFLTHVTTPSLLTANAVNQTALAFTNTFRALNRRVLSTIGTTLMLSVLLSACGGGGGSSDTPAPTPTNPTTPTFSVSSSNLNVDENFTGSRTVASVSNATAITVSQSNTGVVTVTNSLTQVNVSSIANATGRTILTIRATNGTLIATTQVIVTVNAVNVPTLPIFSVANSNFNVDEDFTGSRTVASVSNATAITVSQSNTGVVTVTNSNAQVNISSIANANGRTTLTIRATNGTLIATTQVIVTVNAVNDTPALAVSSNSISTVGGFSPITINTTASDVEDANISFTVVESTTGVVTVTTSTNAIVLNTISGASGQTTLTVRVVDSSGTTVTQSITVSVRTTISTTPVVTVSTNLISVQENFIGSVVIRTTVTDSDGDTITLSVSSSSRLVDVVLSTPVSGVSTITNMITLTALADLNGTTTLTVRATDAGGISTTEQIVVVVNAVDDPIPFSLSTTAVSLSVHGSQLDRIINAISISNSDNKTLRAQIGVTASGDNIFSANPAPVVSFTTNALTTTATLTSATSTAQLYFTIRPDRTGTATLVVQLTDLNTFLMSQQTMVVHVNSVNVPPVIAQYSSDLIRLVVYGGRIYANDVSSSNMGISRFLSTASALGGHMMNINSIEEYSFVRSPVNSGLLSSEAYFGLVLPKRTFPGELSWITHDSTIAYGYASTNGATNLTVYPGHATLPWASSDAGIGLLANRFGSTSTVSNWPIFSDVSGGIIYLIDNGGDIPARDRNVIYEFPQGLPIANNSTSLNVVGNATVRLTGFDLNGDTITTNDWSITDPNGGSAIFNNDAQNSGVQTVNMIYTPAANFDGQTTVVVTLQVNGLSTTYAISFIVDAPPTIALSTNVITLAEDFSNFVIGTTVTDQGVSGNLAFSVQTASTGIVSLSTTINSIQFSGALNFNGLVTLTVQATDSALQSVSTLVVVTVQAVNDTPILTVSTTALTLPEDFGTVLIATTRTDIDSNNLTLTVSESTTGVVSVTTTAAGVQVTNINNANGATTLTISLSDGTTSTSTQVGVTVTPVNDPPTLSVSINNLATNIDFTPITINVTLSDVEDSTLSFSVVDSNAGVVTFTTSANTIVLNAIAGVTGQTTLTVSLVDSSGTTVTQTIPVVVSPTPNTAPVLVVSTNRITVQEDFMNSVVIRTTVTDAEGGTITLSVSSSSRLVDFAISIPMNGRSTITLTAIGNANGTTTLTVSATDVGFQSDSTEIVVVVTPVEDAPTLTIPTATLTLVEDFDGIITVATAIDGDGDALTISVAQTNPGILTVSTSASGVSVTSLQDEEGTNILTITVSDGKQNTTGQVVVNIRPVNDPPTLIIPSQSITVLEDFTNGIRLASAFDSDGDQLTFSVTESLSGIVRVSTTASGAFISRLENIHGVTTLTISLSDSLLITTGLVVVTVMSINDTPTLSVSVNSISTFADFSTITINTTASDVEDTTLSFSVAVSTPGVVTVTTSTNAIVLNAIAGASGQTILTVRTIDSSSSEVTQTIAVNVAPFMISTPPVLVISTNRIIVQEDFTTSVVFRTTATDADGDTITLSVRSSSRLVDVTISTPINGKSTITNSITLTAITDLNGTTTLTVQATDSGGNSTTEQITVVVIMDDPVPFSLSTSAITLSAIGNQINRNIQSISISNSENKTLRTQFQVTTSGDNIFSANPTPVVSFTTNTLTTTATLTSAATTAQLYFTIRPDQTGTATLVVQLTDLDTLLMSQRTMMVSVNSRNVPPVIVPTISSITNLVVHGGRLYANDLQVSGTGISRFLSTAGALGGHLVNINSVEEYAFVRSPAVSGLTSNESWLGMVLPTRTFPGELSWITHDSTIAYGYASTNGATNLTVYPGHFPLPWNADAGNLGLAANRYGRTTTVSNWSVNGARDVTFLVDDGGDGGALNRNVIYEFPQGLPIASNSTSIRVVTNVAVRLTGFDLNGDTITTNNWSITDPNGGSAIFNNDAQSSGVQTVNMIYTPAANFDGQTTVVVTLQVNGLSTTYAISFIVDAAPTIALSTNFIRLAEDFSNFVIGTTVTDQGVSGNLAFSVQTASTGIVSLSTTINSIQFSGALNFNGLVTLTVQATDSALQSVSTLVVVAVQAVNDTPIITVSTDNITVNGGSLDPITIDTTATDVEDVTLPFSVQASTTGIVSFTTSDNNIILSLVLNGSGQTTLTVTATDSLGAVGIRTIAVNVIVVPSSTPVLRVSTNLISLQEDFATVVIGTTATDADTGTLIVTVSSSTHLVNTVISTHSITLSSIANRFGTTTLTLLATDPGGLADSTEIVVIVQSVNDTPTLTVSSNVISLGVGSIVLDISAFDVEDTTLSISVSGEQGMLNTVITTTNLTISQIGLNALQVVLDLRTTDSGNISVSTSVTVVLPPLFIITTGIKTLDFAWSAYSSATHYRLRSNPDSNSGFTDLSTTGIVVSPNSTVIRQSTAQGLVSLYRYIPRVTNPLYGVDTCDATSCGSSFRHNTIALTNAQLNSMIGRLRASNAGSSNEFGRSISLSGDGNTLAVGAPFEDSGNIDSGGVYVFRRNGGVWLQQAFVRSSNQTLRAAFGYSVSLSSDGNTLAVGAIRESSIEMRHGTAHVFRFNTTTNAWQQQASLVASNITSFTEFGNTLDLSADGNTLAVGSRAQGRIGASGAAYVFRFTPPNTWAEQAFLKASNPDLNDNFGWALGISADGNTLAVGSVGEDSNATGINGTQNNNDAAAAGAVYLFRFSTTTNSWGQQAYIKASNSTASSSFGGSISLNRDGNTFVVGAPNRSNDTGAVYVFRFNTSSGTWTEQAFIRATNAGAFDVFGRSVELTPDGNTFVVGSPNEDGATVGIGSGSGDDNVINNAGAAYVFEFSNGSWVQRAYIKASDPAATAFFGESVSISNDGATVAVGANGVSQSSGAVYLY